MKAPDWPPGTKVLCLDASSFELPIGAPPPVARNIYTLVHKNGPCLDGFPIELAEHSKAGVDVIIYDAQYRRSEPNRIAAWITDIIRKRDASLVGRHFSTHIILATASIVGDRAARSDAELNATFGVVASLRALGRKPLFPSAIAVYRTALENDPFERPQAAQTTFVVTIGAKMQRRHRVTRPRPAVYPYGDPSSRRSALDRRMAGGR